MQIRQESIFNNTFNDRWSSTKDCRTKSKSLIFILELSKLKKKFMVAHLNYLDIITRSFMRKMQWSELPHGIGLKTSWNVLWTWSKP